MTYLIADRYRSLWPTDRPLCYTTSLVAYPKIVIASCMTSVSCPQTRSSCVPVLAGDSPGLDTFSPSTSQNTQRRAA